MKRNAFIAVTLMLIATVFCQVGYAQVSDAFGPLKPATSLTTDFLPLCVDERVISNSNGTSVVGTPFILTVTDWTSYSLGPGNIGRISFDGDSGAEDYVDRIAGYSPPVSLNLPASVNTLPGSDIRYTEKGLNERLYGDHWTYDSWLAAFDPTTLTFPSTRRTAILPVVIQSYSYETLEVVGFAPVFIEGYSRYDITCRFIASVSVNNTLYWDPFSTGYTGNNLVMTPVPEPSSITGILTALAGLGGLTLRKRTRPR